MCMVTDTGAVTVAVAVPVAVAVYLPRGAAKLDVLVLFASRCYTTLLRGDLDILFEY